MSGPKEIDSSASGASDSLEEKIVKMLDPSRIEELFTEGAVPPSEKHTLFREKLASAIEPYLPAKELTARVVRVALEIEYGQDFAQAPQFAKMVDVIANTIVTNPELRRQVLAMMSPFIEAKIKKPERPD